MNTNAEKDYGKILGDLGLDSKGVDAVQSMQMGIDKLNYWFLNKMQELEARLKASEKIKSDDIGAFCMAYCSEEADGDSVINTGVGSFELMMQCWRGMLSGMIDQIGVEKIISLLAYVAAEKKVEEQNGKTSSFGSNVINFPSGGRLQ